MSTPVESIWASPLELRAERSQLRQLARSLEMAPDRLQRLLSRHHGREFVYLRRHAPPAMAQAVKQMQIPGVYTKREYRRFYPSGEVAAHVVGFSNIDDEGQEGLELAYDDRLHGEAGAKRVIRDRLGSVVEDVENIRMPRPGQTLQLTLDRRLQYLAYRELKAAVLRHRAKAGSLVLLDVQSGDVLALVNQPSYNPNDRSQLKSDHFRNRALTDQFEPGSTIKPLVVAAALEAGVVGTSTRINTAPGRLQVSNFTVRDSRNLGPLKVSEVLQKSSNVGVVKIAQRIAEEDLYRVLDGVRFGKSRLYPFPGESEGRLDHYSQWGKVQRATIAYGYGLSVNLLQLAEAYSVLARDGLYLPSRMVVTEEAQPGLRVLTPEVAGTVRHMLEGVVGPEGTAQMAAVDGYSVAGKTGTVHKLTAKGYADDSFISLFAGMVPASKPRLLAVVMIDDPRGEKYYGGNVAAPVFSSVISGALRLLDIAPDRVDELRMAQGHEEGRG